MSIISLHPKIIYNHLLCDLSRTLKTTTACCSRINSALAAVIKFINVTNSIAQKQRERDNLKFSSALKYKFVATLCLFFEEPFTIYFFKVINDLVKIEMHAHCEFWLGDRHRSCRACLCCENALPLVYFTSIASRFLIIKSTHTTN